MSNLTVTRLESLSELRRVANAWDDLWQRSEVTLPTARAEMIALWGESFAARRPFTALVVEHDGQFIGALPLVETRLWGLKAGSLPGNLWSPAGDLLLDPQANVAEVCESLLAALRKMAWPLLRFDTAPSGSTRWQAFLRALEQQSIRYVTRRQCEIDLVEIHKPWDDYFADRSRNHSRHVRRAAARAKKRGPTELARHDNLAPEQVESLLRSCFEIEASGWKGRAQTAILQAPAAWDFYLRQARQLAAWGQLSVNVLHHRSLPIAFEYGWRCKGVYCTPKVGYDEAFRQLTPGQLLRYRLLEQLHDEPDVRCVDFLGPASPATSKWATRDYSIDRMVVALHGVLGRSLLAAYRHCWPLVRKNRSMPWKGDPQPPYTPDSFDGADRECAPAAVE